MAAITVNSDGLKSSWPRSAEVHGSTSAQAKQAGNRNRLKRFCLGFLQCNVLLGLKVRGSASRWGSTERPILGTHNVCKSPQPRGTKIAAGTIDITNDIQSLTTLQRRSGDFMKQLKKNKRPVVLTVKGKAAPVVQDAEAYQRLFDIAADADVEEGIRQGLQDAKKGKVRPAREFFDDFEAERGIRR